jgi:predicted ABC-type exoprotein transport system permease subunit
MYFLTTQPLWVLLLLLILLTGLAMLGPLLIRRHVAFERLRTNNEVAGFKFATIGVLYAVLLAFVVIITWERFYDAEKALSIEEGSAATIYGLAAGFGGPTTATLHARVTAYLESILRDEWPTMAAGHQSPKTIRALVSLYDALVRVSPSDMHGQNLQQEIYRELDKMTEARRERLIMSEGTVPGTIWFVLLLGAMLTIAFTFFFGTQNVFTQCLMTGALAAMVFSALLVIIAIDRPFTGAVVVSQESLRGTLTELQLLP